MRPSADLKPPGIYAAMAESVIAPLEVADTRVCGFVGLAQRGPLDTPRRVTSWEEFLEVYGYDPEHYLSDSVEAFFRNGGASCFVVRVAHAARGEEEPGPEHAACAERVARDAWQKPTLRVAARSEGRWGNNVWVRFAHARGPRALLTQDLEVGAGRAQVSTTRGFQTGALVRIFDRETSDYVVLTGVDEKERVLHWGSDTPVARKHLVQSPTHLEVVEFELHAALRDRREIFKGLQLHPSSRRYAPRVVEEESRLVRLEDLRSGSPPPNHLPVPEPPQKLASGRDGSAALTPEDVLGYDHGPADRAGLMALAPVEEVCQLAVPDAMLFLDRAPGPEGELQARRIQDAMVDLCENLQDRFAVLDCPRTRDIEAVKRWRRQVDSSYAAYYWPWIGVPGRNGAVHRIPPSGVMAGIYARCDAEQGVHQAPANVPVLGAIDLSLPVTEDDLGQLNAEGINVIRLTRGIRPWGARTGSSDPDWRYINVRRLFIMLRRSLEAGMAWVPFEGNDERTWESLTDQVQSFLLDLHRRGMFAGGKPEESFFVKCNAETNPPDNVDRGMLTCEVGVAPAIPAEYLVVQLTERMGGAE